MASSDLLESLLEQRTKALSLQYNELKQHLANFDHADE